ncbi:MAG: HNH endonuclease [Actinomycetota bacterium]|nr:HNH endonuclease [Actinomycetota bacterium]
MLVIGLFVGLPVWYVTGTDLLKVLAVVLSLAILLAMRETTDGALNQAFFGTMFCGLIVAALVWLVFDTGFFAVLGASFLLGILGLMGGAGEREERVHRPSSEQDGEAGGGSTAVDEPAGEAGGGSRTVPISPQELRALPYKEYLQTPHWKRRRQDKVRVAGYRCQLCNRGAVTLNVHHRTYERLGEEHDGDLTVLCSDCHNTFHEHRSLGR